MGTVTIMNGNEPLSVSCHNCGEALWQEKAVASTPAGTRYFCKADPEHPQDSCYLQYRRRFN